MHASQTAVHHRSLVVLVGATQRWRLVTAPQVLGQRMFAQMQRVALGLAYRIWRRYAGYHSHSRRDLSRLRGSLLSTLSRMRGFPLLPHRRLLRRWARWHTNRRLRNSTSAAAAVLRGGQRHSRMRGALLDWRVSCWHAAQARDAKERREILEHVQTNMSDIRAQAASREAKVAELLHDNAALKASTTSMQAFVDRCSSQFASLSQKAEADVAGTWYVDFLEQRIDEMRSQITTVAMSSSHSAGTSTTTATPVSGRSRRALTTPRAQACAPALTSAPGAAHPVQTRLQPPRQPTAQPRPTPPPDLGSPPSSPPKPTQLRTSPRVQRSQPYFAEASHSPPRRPPLQVTSQPPTQVGLASRAGRTVFTPVPDTLVGRSPRRSDEPASAEASRPLATRSTLPQQSSPSERRVTPSSFAHMSSDFSLWQGLALEQAMAAGLAREWEFHETLGVP